MKLTSRVDRGRHPDDEVADLARTLDGMAAQLEHARGLERAFELSVCHDLRTSLTSIRGYTEALTGVADPGSGPGATFVVRLPISRPA